MSLSRRAFIGAGAVSLPAVALAGSLKLRASQDPSDVLLDYVLADTKKNIALARKLGGPKSIAFHALGANVEVLGVWLGAHGLGAKQRALEARIGSEGSVIIAQEADHAWPALVAKMHREGFPLRRIDFATFVEAAEKVRNRGCPTPDWPTRLRRLFEHCANVSEERTEIVSVQLDPVNNPCAYGLWDQCPGNYTCRHLAVDTAWCALMACLNPEVFGPIAAVLGVLSAELCDPLEAED
jgi:hypothetical protein